MIDIKDLIVITGATASGKTALSVKLAKELNTEIVNADSMQIYKYMNIGTAKPTKEEMENVPHHLIDILTPDQNFSVADYCKMANEKIQKIQSNGKVPILVGGTGLYVDSLVNNIQFSDIKSDEKYRVEMEDLAKEYGNEHIYNMLIKTDPESAKKIEVADRKRIIRALEVYHCTGKTITWHNQQSKSVPSPYNTYMFAIDMDRAKLYDKINRRVDIMFEMGLVDEVRSILNMGVDKNCTSMQAIGYKEVIDYIDGVADLDSVKDIIKQSSRRYAKRQLTWFRRNKKINWIDNDINQILKIYR